MRTLLSILALPFLIIGALMFLICNVIDRGTNYTVGLKEVWKVK